MELCLFSKHTISVCAWAVLVRLISVFHVKLLPGPLRSHLGIASWAVVEGGAERLWLVWISRGGKSGVYRRKNESFPHAFTPTSRKDEVHRLGRMCTYLSHYSVLGAVSGPSPCVSASVTTLSRVDPMLRISATLFLWLLIFLTDRPAIPTSYTGHWEAAAHTAKSSALLLQFFFLSCSQAAGNPQRKSQKNESQKFKCNVFSSSAMGPPGLHSRTFALL